MAPMQRIGALIRALPFVKQMLTRLQESPASTLPELDTLVAGFLAQLGEGASESGIDLSVQLNRVLDWNHGNLEPSQDDMKTFHGLQRRLTRRSHERAQAAWVASLSENLTHCERVNRIIAPEAGRALNVSTNYRPNHI